MRHEAPHSLYINCRNHRLALCLKHLMRHYPVLTEVDSAMLALWKLFQYSPKKFSVFEKVQESYGIESLTVIRAAVTRWLSHGKACIRFINRYKCILDTLDFIYDDSKEPEVFGLRAILTKKPVVAMIVCLCDVLKIVNILSLTLQDPNLILSKVDERVKSTINQLDNLKSAMKPDGVNHGDTYYSRLPDLFSKIDDRTSLQIRLRGNNNALTPEKFIQDTGIPFIDSLIGEITDQLHINPVLKSFEALDPKNLPDESRDLPEYGEVTAN